MAKSGWNHLTILSQYVRLCLEWWLAAWHTVGQGSFERFRYSEALLQGIAFANEVLGQTPTSTIDITTEPTAFQSA